MKHSHRLAISALIACLLVAVCFSTSYTQTPASNAPSVVASTDINQALNTLNTGDTKSAVAALKQITKARPNDGDAWHYLGFAYKQKNDRGAARKAFKRAYEIRSEAAFGSLYVETTPEPEQSKEILETRRKLLTSRFRAAISSLEQLASVDTKSAKKDAAQLDSLRALVEDFRAGNGAELASFVYLSKDVDERAVILSKPEPAYSERARENNIIGDITVRLLLGADGKVRLPSLLKRLGYGLDERAIRAALAIKFKPAQKNGRPVSTFVQVNYSFFIY